MKVVMKVVCLVLLLSFVSGFLHRPSYPRGSAATIRSSVYSRRPKPQGEMGTHLNGENVIHSSDKTSEDAVYEHPEETSASSIFVSDVSRFGINTV